MPAFFFRPYLLKRGLWGVALLAFAGAAAAQDVSPDLYTMCAFYPQGAPCAALYQRALKESAPPASAVRQAFEGYARYLTGSGGGLSDADKAWLTANGILIPVDLNSANQGGLHNVINDPALLAKPEERLRAVNNFIGRARQAELYCHFNGCGAPISDRAAEAAGEVG
jgi:hypothetical protein